MALVRSRTERASANSAVPHPIFAAATRQAAEATVAERMAALDQREAALAQREAAIDERQAKISQAITDGVAAVTAGWQDALASLQAGVASLRQDADAARRASVGQCQELALLMAAKLVGKIAVADDQWLLERWEELLVNAAGFDHVQITVPVSAEKIIREHLQQFGSEMSIELIADATLPVGGCRIQYGGTILEADLGHQWQQITQYYRDRGSHPVTEIGDD